MTETLLQLVASYGALVLGVATFLSCLAMPVPTSLMMLAGGAFVASGDLALASVAGAALTGAVFGDQAGYALGRSAGGRLLQEIERHPARARLVHKARGLLGRFGGTGVFLSRWLFSPLGPYVNLIGGAAGLGWARFSIASVLGETVWVALYIGLGAAFSSDVVLLADLLGNLVATLALVAVAAALGYLLLQRLREERS
ncbi:MAG: VTT domain-containing protein [Alphaproteobacteria bacterium]|nr:VTT domain-containing protein [Alphaproteobacteria bacterium]